LPIGLYTGRLFGFNVKSTKHSMLELLILAVRWSSLPLPLSAVEGNAVSAHYYGIAVPFITTCWYSNWYTNWYSSKNSRTGNMQPLAAGGAATFSASIGKMAGCLNWILDNIRHSCNPDDPASSVQVPGNNTPCRSDIVSMGMPGGRSFSNVI